MQIYQQMKILQIFPISRDFFHRIVTIYPPPPPGNFWKYSALHHSYYRKLDHELPICKFSCFYQKVYD